MKKPVPVIDLFAGPGGLGEGFSRCKRGTRSVFDICVSVERDPWAHATLTLRSFMRQFPGDKLPDAYYEHLRGKITMEKLFEAWPCQAEVAKKHTLGRPHEMGTPVDDKAIDQAIVEALKTAAAPHWVLVGGPPCQAYSLSGRSRRARESREEFEKDKRHFLYEEYLRVIRKFMPSVFVMENVKGLLSATVSSKRVLANILHDLSSAGYELYSLSRALKDGVADADPAAFIVRAEDYGAPQKRHRIFIMGVRKGLDAKPRLLTKRDSHVPLSDAIGDLPRIRSHISLRTKHESNSIPAPSSDTLDEWKTQIRAVHREWFDAAAWEKVKPWLSRLGHDIVGSDEFLETAVWQTGNTDLKGWCHDPGMGGIPNHAGRCHMPSDLRRYFYVAAYGKLKGHSPQLQDLPSELLPEHANVDREDVPHTDRFKVQVETLPSSTITCHISKDGHYYIHPDPTQCRSLTAREAARLQTFPDNYLFEGSRTEQYKQVGNAVPPFLAAQIADIVADLLGSVS
jgi:DNA (cytosine-5)-methyltransferase 1